MPSEDYLDTGFNAKEFDSVKPKKSIYAVEAIKKAMEGYTHVDGREYCSITLSVNAWGELLNLVEKRNAE